MGDGAAPAGAAGPGRGRGDPGAGPGRRLRDRGARAAGGGPGAGGDGDRPGRGGHRPGREKAAQRGLEVRFLVGNVLDLADLGEQFDTALDSGLFHVLEDDDRSVFVAGLRGVVRPGGRYFLLCFSDRQPGVFGPRRITQDEIRAAFADGWRVDSIEPVMMDSAVQRGAVHAWLAAITRT